MKQIFYNTQHSPVGAFASFTLGAKGAKGGLGLELAGPACENIWIGCEDRQGMHAKALPFFADAGTSGEEQFGVESENRTVGRIQPFAPGDLIRELSAGRDTWIAGDLRFTIYTQAPQIPDPELEDSDQVRQALVPAVLCELVVDNRHGQDCRRVFLGWQGGDPRGAMRCVEGAHTVGIAQGQSKGFFGAAGTWVAGQGFRVEEILDAVRQREIGRLRHGVGPVCALVAEVPAGGVSVLHLVASFWSPGVATTGIPCQYWYTKWWNSLEHAAEYALSQTEALVKASKETEDWTIKSGLSRERRWMLAQALHSYYGSTQLLEQLASPGIPLWVVNEGEYRMMNTMDLQVDHLFLEMKRHPWTVRSVLDHYLRFYSTSDALGLTFRHDMGVANSFAQVGSSAYEQPHRKGCFSFMCMEELVNWVLCAIGYAKLANDIDWLHQRRRVIDECIASLTARDHLDEASSLGVMQFDSDRCEGGYEITTYDSLDQSLGRARGSMYLAVKTWAAWLALEWHFQLWEQPEAAARMRGKAERAAASIMKVFHPRNRFFPALLDGSCKSATIPAIEGLVFPWFILGKEMVSVDGPFGNLIRALTEHLNTVMLARCRFPDGGWKLSETSDNSWLSKIYLCQAIAEKILHWKDPEREQADRAHLSWLLDEGNSFYAWSDQMLAGKVCGSRYYPRGVTAILWLK